MGLDLLLLWHDQERASVPPNRETEEVKAFITVHDACLGLTEVEAAFG